MRRLWGWYRARRWWWKVLIAGPILFITSGLLFVLVRWFQFAACADITADEFVPGSAQVVVRLHDLEGRWPGIQKGEAWKVFSKRMLREPLVRGAVNSALKEFQLPTVDQLEDRRFQDRTGGWYAEDRLLWVAGRDVMAALKVGQAVEQTRFCAATKMDFLMFLGAPFAPIGARFVGATTETVGGSTCIKRGPMYVALEGSFAIACNDRALMAEALQRKGRGKPPALASLAVRFDGAQVLENAKRSLKTFPTGIVTVVADPAPMTRLELAGDVQGGDLLLDATIEGVTPTSDKPAPTIPLKWAPATGGGALTCNVDAKPVWAWMESVANETRPPWNGVEMMGRTVMKVAIRELTLAKIPELIIPKVNGPLTVIYGTAPGEGANPAESATYGVAAFAFKSDDAMGLMDEISKFVRKFEDPRVMRWTRERYQGFEWGHADFVANQFHARDFKNPCIAVVEGHVILAHNIEFMRAVLDAAAGQSGTMLDEEYFRFARKRIEKAGLKQLFSEGTIVSGYFNGLSVLDGLDGYFPLWASATDNSEFNRKLWADVVAEFQKDGRPVDNKVVGDIVLERVKAAVMDAEQSYRDAAKLLQFLSYAAFETVPVPNAIKARAVMGLKLQ